MEDLLHKFVLNFIPLTSQMQVLYGLESAGLLWAGLCRSFKFCQIFPGRCIFWRSCIRCWSKCIFCIECWRASSRNLSSFSSSHNSIDYCVDTHTYSLEYFQENPKRMYKRRRCCWKSYKSEWMKQKQRPTSLKCHWRIYVVLYWFLPFIFCFY